MRTIVIVACLAAGAFLVGLGVGTAPVEKPLVRLSGSYSAIKKARVEVIGDQARWEAVWKEHTADKLEKSAHGFDVVPQIEFSRCMVLAAFSGDRVNGSGVDVPEVFTREGHTVIRYDRIAFQTASFDGKDSGIKTTDYGFAIITRSALPIVLEENTQGLIGKPPIWTERQRLPALPEFKAEPQGQRGN